MGVLSTMSSNSGHKLERDTFVMICKGSISYVPRSQTEPANHLIYGIADNRMTFSRKSVTVMAVPSLPLVKSADLASPGIAQWDPVLTKRVVGFLRPIAKRYFRSEIGTSAASRPAVRCWSPTTPATADAVAERDRLQRQDRICPRRH